MERVEIVKILTVEEYFDVCKSANPAQMYGLLETERVEDLEVFRFGAFPQTNPSRENFFIMEDLFCVWRGRPVLYRTLQRTVQYGKVTNQAISVNFEQPEGPNVYLFFHSNISTHKASLMLSDKFGHPKGVKYKQLFSENPDLYYPAGWEVRNNKALSLKDHPLAGVSLDVVCEYNYTTEDNPLQVVAEIKSTFDGEIDIDDRKYRGSLEEVCTFPNMLYPKWSSKIWNCDEELTDPKRPWLNWFSEMGGKYSLRYFGRFVD